MPIDPRKINFKKKSRLTKSMQAYVRWQVCEDYLELATPTTVQEAIDAVTIQQICTTPWIVDYNERLEEVKMAFEGIAPDTLVWELFAGEEEIEEEILEISVEVASKPIRHGFKSPPPAFKLPSPPVETAELEGTPKAIIEASTHIVGFSRETKASPTPIKFFNMNKEATREPPTLSVPAVSSLGATTAKVICNCTPKVLFGKETHQVNCATRKS